MPLRLPCLIILTLLAAPVLAQHADLGTGTLKNEIWWLNWAGFTISNGASRTFTTNDGLQITVTFSNASTRVPTPTVMSSNYSGSMLYLLYDFSDPTILPSLYDGPEETGAIQYSMSITAARNGVAVPFYLVTADAEASWEGETMTFTSNGSSWQCINLYQNSNQSIDPLTGCGAQTISIHDTYDGQPQGGQSPIIMTQAPSSGPLNLDVSYDHASTTGAIAVAFGILQSEDRGDLPVSYGTAQHQLNYTVTNSCNFYPSPLPSMTQDTRLFIGSVPGDADPIQYTDDDAIGVDEEAISSFPVYNGSGSYTLTFPLTNTTGNDAWLTGWFDYNRDGNLQPTEAETIRIPNNTTSATLTWTGLPQYLPQTSTDQYAFRLRLSSDQQAAQQATGFAKDGEVEDYLVPAQTLCTTVTPGITSPQTICSGQPTPLQSSGGSTYSWSPATYLSDPNSANPIAAPLTTTTYTVTATNPQGCAGNASVTLTTLPLPAITASNNATICQNSSITLQASGGVTYSWTASDPAFQSTGPSVTVTPPQSTSYYVSGMSTDGCSVTDTISITTHTVPAFDLTPPDTTVCVNSPVSFLVYGGDQYSQYSWLSPSGTVLGVDSGLSIFAGSNGIYQVTITDLICQVSETLTASVNTRPLPQLSITSSNNIDCTLGQSTLQVTGGIDYQWQSAPGIANLYSPTPVVDPLSTTTYYVKGTDRYGCTSIDSITVNVNDSIDLSKYPVPSAFTPNNDGHNDCFGLKYWGHITTLSLAVYNRQGQQVFSTNDPTQCWDGTYHGIPQPAGGYVYQIKATTACGIAYRKGIVILVR